MFVLKSTIEAMRLEATKTKPQGNLSKKIQSLYLNIFRWNATGFY